MKRLALVLWLLSAPSFAGSFTLGAGNGSEADGAWLNFNSKSANSGTANSLFLGGDSAYTGYAYLIFNWPALKDSLYNNTVDACTLFVYVTFNENTDGLYGCYQIRSGRDWTESGVSWNNYKASTAWTIGGARDTAADIYPTTVAAATETDLSQSSYHGFAITSIARQWDGTDTANCRGVIIKQYGGADPGQLTIPSDDFITVGQRPKIKVVYHAGIDPPVVARRRKTIERYTNSE
jgi:hypothetical protein